MAGSRTCSIRSLALWLRRIAVPALVLWGESDRIVTPDYGRAYAQRIPGATFQVIAAAGHHPELSKRKRLWTMSLRSSAGEVGVRHDDVPDKE